VSGSVWQQNAARFASTPEPYIDQERRAGIAEAMELVRQGRPGYAAFKLARSVERQNRIAGNGSIAIPICAACGTVCAHVSVVAVRP
jgi:hypothetical protein